jgi:hypothetical protein
MRAPHEYPDLQDTEVAEQVFDGSPGRKRLYDHANSDAHAPNTRLSAHDLGISGYPAELLHVVRIALNSAPKRSVPRRIRERSPERRALSRVGGSRVLNRDLWAP